MTRVDIERVSGILRETVATLIAPRFRTLADADVEEKSPGEIVTIADREAEAFITRHLQDLLPGVPVVGEEATSENPALIDAARSESVAWLVDPLDGTSNFASGDPHWAVLIALVRNGETVASWTAQPDGRIYVAELGGGAWLNGERLQLDPASRDIAHLRGAVLQRFLTPQERARMTPRLGAFGDIRPGVMCSGFEYPEIVRGRQDFALFQRVLPWDHAPGSLLLTESGGVARHPNGDPYQLDHTRRGLLLATSEENWEAVRDSLYGDVFPGR